MGSERSGTPAWIWGIILGLSAIDPLQHLWLMLAPPAGWAHSGFHIGDTPFFLTAMNIFTSDFNSPYALCDAEPASWRYFALPHHWVYGALGAMAALLHVPHFLALGLANGVCGAAYVYAVFRFLSAVQPVLARTAFVLFALCGGIGGALYLGAALTGWSADGNFETIFHRIARYELVEGPFIAPILVMPRLYYTAPLALGYILLARLLRREGKMDLLLLLGLFAVTIFNARVGVLFFGAAACFFITRSWPGRQQIKTMALLLLPVATGGVMAAWLLSQNPAGAENVDALLRRVAWLGSLVSLLCWHLVTVPGAIRETLLGMPAHVRGLAGALIGYLTLYAGLYLIHQAYYGNLLHGGDTAAALAVSKWALFGTVPPILWGLFQRRPMDVRERANNGWDGDLGWVALWFLGLLAFSVSAFERGLTLNLMPERGLVLLGPPLALLSARGLVLLQSTRPRLARVWLPVTVASGLASLAVASLFFQGPLGQSPEGRSFRWAHSEIVAEHDIALIAQLPPGRYLAPASLPPILGDVIVHNREDTRTVFGQPSLEFSGANMVDLIHRIRQFFDSGAGEAEQQAFLQEHCVDFVYCPATWPVDPLTLARFRAVPWLEETQRAGVAVVFRVVQEALQ